MTYELLSVIVFLLPWLAAFLVAALVFSVLHLFYRPELQNGQMLETIQSHRLGVGGILLIFWAMLLYRGATNTDAPWMTSVFLAGIDLVVIVAGAALPTQAFRWRLGEPRRSDPRFDLQEIDRQAEEIFNATGSGS